MSAQAMTWVLENSHYSGELRIIHLVIADIANDLYDNQFRLGEESLAANANCSINAVRQAIKRMVEDGYLGIIKHSHEPDTPSIYRFLMPTTLFSQKTIGERNDA